LDGNRTRQSTTPGKLFFALAKAKTVVETMRDCAWQIPGKGENQNVIGIQRNECNSTKIQICGFGCCLRQNW
jgi:hypothetical protein